MKKHSIFLGIVIIISMLSLLLYLEIQKKFGINSEPPLPHMVSPAGFI